MVARSAKLSSNFHPQPTLRREQALWHLGYARVAGVDEVGRGAWAGPIVVAAVLIERRELPRLRRQPWFSQVADSKQITPVVRAMVAAAARGAVRWAVAGVSSSTIDSVGIAEANRRAVRLAVARLVPAPRYVLADYVARLGVTIAGAPARTIAKGDATVFSIALASIIAKVHRDNLMQALDTRYPGYGFAKHKGYGTALHRAALRRLGPCPQHRRSYRPVASALL